MRRFMSRGLANFVGEGRIALITTVFCDIRGNAYFLNIKSPGTAGDLNEVTIVAIDAVMFYHCLCAIDKHSSPSIAYTA
jgi:hypothetical protein